MSLRYVAGFDIGSNSVGFAFIEVDDDGAPVRILRQGVHRHDSGVGPQGNKTAESRLMQAGVARRTRRLIRRRVKRLAELDSWLESQGWALLADQSDRDPYAAWKVRARLVEAKVDDDAQRGAMIALALRHIARHRGWRSPYARVGSLFAVQPDSPFLKGLKERVAERGAQFPDDATPGQVIAALSLSPSVKLRGPEGLLGGKLAQSDNAAEIRKIGAVQGLSEGTVREAIKKVFDSESPRGSADARAGKDPLPGQGKRPRAPKASPAFQKYRIVSIVANLRIAEGGGRGGRPLTAEEMQAVAGYLESYAAAAPATWDAVADELGIDRGELLGTAGLTADGERASARPPVNVTARVMGSVKVSAVKEWWLAATESEQEALVHEIETGKHYEEDPAAAGAVAELLAGLEEEDLTVLDDLDLQPGRAAYSRDSLSRLTERMLKDGCDVHEARKRVFGVADDWAPPADPIGTPVGNPAVDRVLKIVGRVLLAAESEWGAPEQVNIEHVRSGLTSERAARELERELSQRAKRNDEVVKNILASGVDEGQRVTGSDIKRYKAVARQNSQCLYCGAPITMATCEMDHIVPRKGLGSTNRRDNLAAVCQPCNRSKGNQLFSTWAASGARPGVVLGEAVARVRFFVREAGDSAKGHNAFKREVVARLKRKTEDPEFDGRSLESVAWMANLIHARVKEHFRERGADVGVGVYRGQITAEARKASGIDKRIRFIDGSEKTRLDRRHHAVDAAVVAMMRQAVSTVLAERLVLRDEQNLRNRGERSWLEHTGRTVGHRELFSRWQSHMSDLCDLMNEQLDEDRIPVMTPKRLKLGDGKAHEDTVHKLVWKPLTEAFTPEEVDRASTPALWCALTRQPDWDPKEGLPARADRQIRVRDKWYSGDDAVSFFATKAASLAVRGGSVELGASIHHARFYRFQDGRRMRFGMVRVYTVDLQRHRHEDLFSVPLPPQSISMRTASANVREALADGRAEYLGWMVVDDELHVNVDAGGGNAMQTFNQAFPQTRCWTVAGFPHPEKLRLRPNVLAAEGLLNLDRGKMRWGESTVSAVQKTIDRPGWRPSVNVLLRMRPTIVRRDALGRPRLASSAGLPVTWRVPEA